MNISEVLVERQKSLFVGRETELDFLKQSISEPNWNLLNIYGPGGIGKTTLLNLFASTLEKGKYIYLDGRSGFQHPDDFLAKIIEILSEQTDDPVELLNRYADQLHGIVLFLDTFEQWGAIEHWLRDDFLLKLNAKVKVIIAGRYALIDRWMRGGWHSLVRNIELKPLTSTDVQAYASIRGIHGGDLIESLIRFSHGVPLALSMACEIMIRQGKITFLDQPQEQEMIGYLAAQLTNHIGDDTLIQYLEAGSSVWKFDQELLQALLQEQIPTNRFREFCELPFVSRFERYWTIHDAIRQWIFMDLRSRKPQTFQNYRERALQLLQKKETEQSIGKSEFAFEKLYLHEDDVVRRLSFQWDDRLIYRECTMQDRDNVEQLYQKFIISLPFYVPGDVHLEQLIQPLWEGDPTAFHGLWKEDQLVAYSSCVSLNEHTIQIFRNHPLTQPATKFYEPGQQQSIICLAAIEPSLALEISGSLARALVKLIDRHALFIMLLPLREWSPYLSILGYERIPWADSYTPQGVQYYGYQLDLRTKSIDENKPTPSELRLTMDEAIPLVQRALKQYARLPLQPELAYSLRVLLRVDTPEQSPLAIAHQLQTEIQDILQLFSVGSKEECRHYQILRQAYTKKVGTHEQVAEYLDVSAPTYYRYLRTAVRELTYRWMRSTNE